MDSAIQLLNNWGQVFSFHLYYKVLVFILDSSLARKLVLYTMLNVNVPEKNTVYKFIYKVTIPSQTRGEGGYLAQFLPGYVLPAPS